MKKNTNNKEKIFYFGDISENSQINKSSKENILLEGGQKNIKSSKDEKKSFSIIKSPIFNKIEKNYSPEELEPRFKNSTPVLNNTKNLTSKILNINSNLNQQQNHPLEKLSQIFSKNEKEKSNFQSVDSNDSSSMSSSSISPNIINKNGHSKLLHSNTFNSNLFTKNAQYQIIQRSNESPQKNNNTNNSNFQPQPIPLQKNDHLTNNRRPYTTLLGNNFQFDSLINFEYIKNFTTLDYNDLIREELIYSADICKVYKGKYLFLPVAIKVYNISKLKEEDLVRKNILI
jgi:hypothetical protein